MPQLQNLNRVSRPPKVEEIVNAIQVNPADSSEPSPFDPDSNLGLVSQEIKRLRQLFLDSTGRLGPIHFPPEGCIRNLPLGSAKDFDRKPACQ
jgi:hypothetical protein